jgi:antirestriction protein ArdC
MAIHTGPASTACDAQRPAASLYEEITVRIIANLERGTLPWVQPWGKAGQGAV